MRKLLFVAPDHVGIIKVIIEQLQVNDDYDVDYIDLVLSKEEEFRYKGLAQRIRNFFLKKIRNKNLRHDHYNDTITGKIKKGKEHYDIIIVLRPDLLNDQLLQLLRNRTKYCVAYYWDSVSFYPRKLNVRHFFDRIFSFDLNDCRVYGFELLTNFYFFTQTETKRKQVAYGIATYDTRKTDLEKIGAALEQKGISYCIKAYSQIPFESNHLRCITEMLDYKEMLKEISFSGVIVEVQKEGQNGLSFRPFEAMGMKKKLITNNPLIKKYDFYSADNICVIDPENISIPSGFFSTPYREIDPEVLEKYHFRSWFNTLVSPVPSNFAVG